MAANTDAPATAPHNPSPAAIVASLGWSVSPLPVWFVLNYLRPDLMAPMLDHVFGYVLVRSVMALVGAAIALQLFARFRRSSGWRIALTVVASLLFTVPALLLVVFGPIVFAFMYGQVPEQP